MSQMKVAVVGAGAWGTALACVARRAGNEVRLWARDAGLVDDISAGRGNRRYLPGLPLEQGIQATTELQSALADADAVLLAVPAQALRQVAGAMAAHFGPGLSVALCAKGIELKTGLLMSEVLAEACPAAKPVVLSGPTFAGEVARGLPTAVTVAAATDTAAQAIVGAVGLPRFRTYTTDDVIGAQVGGALKNVLAIAGGIVLGHGLGENARAAMITRGLPELVRLGVARGARRETFLGLSGLGDLILTCSSMQSRNYSLGVALGEGRSLDDILKTRRSVTEGVATAQAVMSTAGAGDLDLPICDAVFQVVAQGAAIDATLEKLLSRPFTAEFGDGVIG